MYANLSMEESKKTPKKVEEQFGPNFRRGTELLHRGEAEKAIKLLQRAHQIEPESIDSLVNLGGAYILRKKFNKAVALLEPASLQYPDHAMIWINLGAAYLGNPILANRAAQLKAIAAFKQALSLNPIAPNVAYNIGLIYRDRREIDEALVWFRKAIKANPNDNDAKRLIEKLELDLGT